MCEPQVELVEPKAFSIDISPVGAPMTIGAESDQIVVVVRLGLRPRYDVVNINFDVSAGGDRTSVTGLHENAPFDISRYCGSVFQS